MASRSDPKLDAAHRLYGMGAFAPALDALEKAAPGPERLLLVGACLARLRRPLEATEAFAELLAQSPDCHEALTWMAILRRESPQEALAYARRAVALRPQDASGHGALGTLQLAIGDLPAAGEAFRRAADLAPDVPEHRHNLGLAYRAQGRHDEAVEAFRAAVALSPQSPQSHLALAETYLQFGMAGPALDALSEGLSVLPDCAPLQAAAAGAFASIRNDEAAERHHRRAAELSPAERGGLAAWLLNQGRFAEADEAFRALVRDGTNPAFGFYGLMLSRKRVDDAFVEEMESLLDSELRPRDEMYLRYALGRAEEGHDRYGEAMGHFDAANRLAQHVYHRGRPTDPERFERESEEVRKLYERIRGGEGDPSDGPVFIVGMIRSGTTLLDQIVSSHPDMASGGELRFWIEESRRLALGGQPDLRTLAQEYLAYARLLARTEGRFTDKMPLNFASMGVIHAALPNARFLHIRRHPADVALSIWTTFFGQGPAFAYDKASIVAYYRQYLRAMAFWRETLPEDRLLEIDYEGLTADPEPTIRRAIDFLGLPWDDACLRHDENAGAINTPSRWQARQPIYRTSVARWRSYEPWLGEFEGLLRVEP